MGAYKGWGQDTSTPSTTIIQLKQPATALKRLKTTNINIGSDVSADSAFEAVIKRSTDAGTPGSSFTPTKHDPADGAASGVFNVAHSVEPAYTANSELLAIFAHQRAGFQWVALPGHELVIPVTNDAGIGLFINTAAAPFNMGASFEWEE